jgi:uncharacterized protein (DUF1499 family)
LIGWLSACLAACTGERPNNLGAHGDKLTECPGSPNCVSSQAEDAGHRIAPLEFGGDPGSAFARLKKVLSRRNDTTILEERPGYLRVEFHTILFVDDGEFLLEQRQPLIHLRSASRLGYSDLGKNRRRMEEIRRQFADETASANIEGR